MPALLLKLTDFKNRLSLRASKKDVEAHKIPSADKKENITAVSSAMLKKGDIVIVKAGEQIPGDGEVIGGAASVDESAITGESAPVIREAGGDRSAVTGGTTVLSDWIVVRITSEAGESFLDKMIAMVEGASRKKTPNKIALQIFLVALSIIFILVTVSLYTYSIFSAKQAGIDNPTSVTTLVALLVCLAPTTIGALLSAIGIAGMSRLNQANVLAISGRAIEAAGDVDILMPNETGTIKERVEKLRKANPDMDETAIPVDLVTCSGSGLDPHISPTAAEYQVARIAKANDMTEDEVREIIEKCTDGKLLGLFGEEETVNVLKVNLMLDRILK